MDLNGTAAVVTGGASGLGLATATALVARGAVVHVLARHGTELPSGMVMHECDVSDADAVAASFETVCASGPPLRVVVSCAGVGGAHRLVGPSGPHPAEVLLEYLRVNVVGTFNAMVSGASAMARSSPDAEGQRGVVVNTSSIAATDGQVGQVAYAASKGAVDAMTLPAARDLTSVGVRVVTIAPGVFATEALTQIGDQRVAELAGGVPFPRRLGLPEEFASLVLSAVDNPYLNGVVLRLDGALRMSAR